MPDYIDGGVGDDQLYGANATDGQNEIYGREGNDIIYDGDQGAYIEGNEGDDKIRAGGGNDIIDGGTGNDYIQDDHGDDTVVFKLATEQIQFPMQQEITHFHCQVFLLKMQQHIRKATT